MAAPAAGPPCATCGAPLRWFHERGVWGCERCLAIGGGASPYAPSAAPAAPGKYSPFRPPPPPEQQAAVAQQQLYAAAPGGKRMWLAVGGGVALLVVVAIVFAVAGGGGARGGASSRDDLIERTLRAIGKHDVDALVALADPGGLMARVVECADKPKDGDEDRDPETAIRKARDRYDKLLRDLPEVTLELVDVRDKSDDAKPLIEKGDKMMKGCVARMAIYLREATAIVKVARAGKPGREQKIELSMIEADGRFYLSDPPKLDISADNDATIEKIADFKDKMCACKDKACGEQVSEEFTRWGTQMARDAGSRTPKLSDADAKRMADLTKDYADCYMKTVTMGGAPSDLADPPGDMSSECNEYHRLVERYVRCDGYPQSARDSVKSTWNAMVQLWPQATATTRSSMSDTCRDSARVVKQGLDTMCP